MGDYHLHCIALMGYWSQATTRRARQVDDASRDTMPYAAAIMYTKAFHGSQALLVTAFIPLASTRTQQTPSFDFVAYAPCFTKRPIGHFLTFSVRHEELDTPAYMPPSADFLYNATQETLPCHIPI